MHAKARFCGACGSEIARPAAAFSVDQAAPGVTLGRWKLVRALPPRGSAARKDKNLLWEAQEEGTGARALVQLMPRSVADSGPRVADLTRVCDAWSRVDHPALVKLVKLEHDPAPFLAMEHVDGVSLEELLASRAGRKEPFGPDEVAALLPPVAEALDILADRGLTHGCVEPGTIVVPDSRTGPAARVMLPGAAALIRDSATPASSAEGLPAAGVPIYLAPEQLKGRPADRATDVYALALTIAHLIGGRHPLVEKARNADPLATVPAGLRPVLERSLAAPEMRHSSAGQLVREFVTAVRALPPAPEVTIRMNPAPAPARPAAPAEEMEKTIRFVPGMHDSSLAPAPQPAPAAQATTQNPVRPPAPASAQSAIPTPTPVRPAPQPEVEKTIRFVPGMHDSSMAAPPPAVPRAAAPPPPPPPVTSSHGAEVEKTVRFVPGMQDASQAPAPTPPPAPAPAPASQAAPAPAEPDAQPAGQQQPEAGGGAAIEWIVIVVLGLIALWQIAKTLG